MTGANWAVTNAVTSASRYKNRLTHCNFMRLLLSPMSPIETPETLENARKKRKRRMTHQFTLNFTWRDGAAQPAGAVMEAQDRREHRETRRAGNARQGVGGPGPFRAYPVSTDTHYILC